MNPNKYKNAMYHGRSICCHDDAWGMQANYLALYLCILKKYSSTQALRVMGIAECKERDVIPIAKRLATAAYVLTKVCGLRYIDAAEVLGTTVQIVGIAVKRLKEELQ